jgi:iron(III) transport system permease protein
MRNSMWGWQSSRTAVIGAAGVVFAIACLLPLGYLVTTSLTALSGAAAALLLDARQWTLLANTALLGAGAAALSTIIGVPLGITLARVPLRRKNAIRIVLAAPMLLPPYLVGLAWIYLWAGLLRAFVDRDVVTSWIYSLPAAIVVLSLVFYPLSMLASEIGLRQIDGRLEEAALLAGPRRLVLRRITLPLAAPMIAAAALVVFVLAVSEFGVPGLLQVRVYTTEVFTAFAALYDFSRALVLALPLLAVCAIVGAAAAQLLGGRMLAARRLTGNHPLLFDEWRRGGPVIVTVVTVVAVVLPIAVLAHEASSIRSLRVALAGSGEAIANSLMLSALGATVVSAVAMALGYARARARGRGAHVVDILFVVLFAVPSTIVGVALIGLWNRPGAWGAIYGTDAMFILAYLARFVTVAALILAAAVRYVPISHEEAAAVAGIGWSRTMWRIVLPQARLGIAAAWIVVFVLSFGELGASVLIAPPGESTLPIRIYTIIANAPPAQVAVLALLQALVVLTPAAILGIVASLREPTRARGGAAIRPARGRPERGLEADVIDKREGR